ncbi:MAG: hypothetical protein IPG45_16095 [Deltaproteobacteria bacterium]|nr:hypothetical protein [Deltaproteobacteria bacterium]
MGTNTHSGYKMTLQGEAAMGWYEEMVERFAVVRDEAIREADAMASPFGESRASRTLQASGVDLAAIRNVAPLMVDRALMAVLRGIEEGRLPLLIKDRSGQVVDMGAEAQGELPGAIVDIWEASAERPSEEF